MAVDATRIDHALEQFMASLRAAGLDAPWTRPGPLIQPKATAVQPRLWRWSDVQALVPRSAEFMKPGRGAERRVVRLDNPGVPERTTTHTISVAVQYLLPGEVAPAHRHTPNAIRFMLSGEGAYTTVEGDRCLMRRGDLVLTPSMTWHDHGNAGGDPVMWIDGLDSPIVRYLENLHGESYPDDAQTPGRVAGISERKFGAPGLRPAWRSADTPPHRSHLIHYRWEPTRAALFRLADVDSSPFDDVIMEYVDPVTGRSVTPVLGCYIQLLRPGVKTRAHRESSSAVYHVVEGSGVTMIDNERFEWGTGDFFAIPPSASHHHETRGGDPAILFSFQDVPLLKALGLYRTQET